MKSWHLSCWTRRERESVCHMTRALKHVERERERERERVCHITVSHYQPNTIKLTCVKLTYYLKKFITYNLRLTVTYSSQTDSKLNLFAGVYGCFELNNPVWSLTSNPTLSIL